MSHLERLEAAGLVGALDVELAELLRRLDPGASDELMLAGALTSGGLTRGDVCVDLTSLADPVDEEGETLPAWSWPKVSPWLDALRASPTVGDGSERCPLVLRGKRLFLARFDAYEASVAERLNQIASTEVPEVDAARLSDDLERLFPGTWRNEEQMAAVTAAASRGLTVLSGGPGTGKTTTVVRLLAVLITQALAAGREAPSILLLAPTGKAAARLSESITSQRAALETKGILSPEVVQAIPSTAQTVHRALRPRNDWLTQFRHDASNPWAADVVLLDEVSMVDLPLMARTLAAVREGARVILLGDPDQLPSVGPGAVLRDLVTCPAHTPVGRSVSRLRHSRRFVADSGIGQLAGAVHRGDAAAVKEFEYRPWINARVVSSRGRLSRDEAFLELAVAGWTAFCQAEGPEAKLAALDAFRVLCATRVGGDGVVAVNEAIERGLFRRGLLRPGGDWYDGQPVLVTANDYQLELFNGDTGVITRAAPGDKLMAWFRDEEGRTRRVVPARLPEHETCFAMTVHKSQGSEFDRLLVGLPWTPNRVLSRELLYTGITRAKRNVTLVGRATVVAWTLARQGARVTGLVERLSGSLPFDSR